MRKKLTGLKAGGISPLALLEKGFQVVLDTSAEQLDHILISGGQWGMNIQISPKDLIMLTNAIVAPISR